MKFIKVTQENNQLKLLAQKCVNGEYDAAIDIISENLDKENSIRRYHIWLLIYSLILALKEEYTEAIDALNTLFDVVESIEVKHICQRGIRLCNDQRL